jgi:hypothetical protein
VQQNGHSTSHGDSGTLPCILAIPFCNPLPMTTKVTADIGVGDIGRVVHDVRQGDGDESAA